MNDFKKGLLVGALLVIGCATFMANSSNVENKKRYEWVKSGLMLDTWEGKLYTMQEPNDKKKNNFFMWYEVDEESVTLK